MIVIALLWRFVHSSKVRTEIPVLSDSQILSEPVNDQISDALESAFQKPTADNLGRLGMAYHSSANYTEAAQSYKLAIKKGESEWIWNYYLGCLNLEMGESNASIENFRDVVRSNPNMDLAWYYLGIEYKNNSKYELAEESLGRIISQKNSATVPLESTRVDHFPISAYAMFQLSRIYFDTERIDLAENLLEKIIESNPTFGPAYRLLGNVYKMKGEEELSKRFGVRANDLIAFAPPVDTLVDRLVLISRSELYLPKKIDEAERGIYSDWTLKLLKNALQYIHDNKYLVSKAIRLYLWVEMDEKAIALMDQHMAYYEESFTEMSNKGDLFYQNGLYPQAIKYFMRALEIEPDDLDLQKKLSISFWSIGEKQKSYDILYELIENSHNNPEILADVIDILYFSFKDGPKSRVYLVELKRRIPSHAKVLKVSAGLAEEDGNFRQAISLYETAFRGDPEDVSTIKFLGNLLLDQSMYDKTLKHYHKALEYHPNDSYFLERYGTLLAGCPDTSLRNTEEGIEYLERAFYHKSTRPNTLVYTGRSLAFAYAQIGETQKAVVKIQQTINAARRANFSTSFIAELESISEQFRELNN